MSLNKQGRLVVEGKKSGADAVPSQIAEAAQGIGFLLRPYVVLMEGIPRCSPPPQYSLYGSQPHLSRQPAWVADAGLTSQSPPSRPTNHPLDSLPSPRTVPSRDPVCVRGRARVCVCLQMRPARVGITNARLASKGDEACVRKHADRRRAIAGTIAKPDTRVAQSADRVAETGRTWEIQGSMQDKGGNCEPRGQHADA